MVPIQASNVEMCIALESEFIVNFLLANVDKDFFPVDGCCKLLDTTDTSLLAVMVAVKNVTMMEKLLAREDIRAEYIDASGHTRPLRIAIGNQDILGVRMMLDAGADPLLHGDHSTDHVLIHASISESHLILEVLIEAVKAAGGSVSPIQTWSGVTPLHFAASNDKRLFVDTLLHAGADPWVRDSWGNLAIHGAVDSGHSVIACKLFANMLPRVTETEKEWPLQMLHYAINRYGSLRFIRTLVENGVDIFARDNGKTALELAMGQRTQELSSIPTKFSTF
jgi:ankyrin repeat protein